MTAAAVLEVPTEVVGTRLMIPLAKIKPNPFNHPREEIDELAAGIASVGQLAPCLVVPADVWNDAPGRDKKHRIKADEYMTINGDRRQRALKKLKHTHADCIVRPSLDVAAGDDPDGALALLLENLQRVDQDEFAEATLLEKIRAQRDLSQDALGTLVGKNQTWVSRRLALLKLPEAAKALVDKGVLEISAAVALTKAGNADAIAAVVDQVADDAKRWGHGVSVDQAERKVAMFKQQQAVAAKTAKNEKALAAAGLELIAKPSHQLWPGDYYERRIGWFETVPKTIEAINAKKLALDDVLVDLNEQGAVVLYDARNKKATKATAKKPSAEETRQKERRTARKLLEPVLTAIVLEVSPTSAEARALEDIVILSSSTYGFNVGTADVAAKLLKILEIDPGKDHQTGVIRKLWDDGDAAKRATVRFGICVAAAAIALHANHTSLNPDDLILLKLACKYGYEPTPTERRYMVAQDKKQPTLDGLEVDGKVELPEEPEPIEDRYPAKRWAFDTSHLVRREGDDRIASIRTRHIVDGVDTYDIDYGGGDVVLALKPEDLTVATPPADAGDQVVDDAIADEMEQVEAAVRFEPGQVVVESAEGADPTPGTVTGIDPEDGSVQVRFPDSEEILSYSPAELRIADAPAPASV